MNHMPKTTPEASLLTPSFQMLISHVGILDLHRGSTVYCLCSIEQSHEPGSDSTASSIKWGMRELKGSEEVTWRLVPCPHTPKHLHSPFCPFFSHPKELPYVFLLSLNRTLFPFLCLSPSICHLTLSGLTPKHGRVWDVPPPASPRAGRKQGTICHCLVLIQ